MLNERFIVSEHALVEVLQSNGYRCPFGDLPRAAEERVRHFPDHGARALAKELRARLAVAALIEDRGLDADRRPKLAGRFRAAGDLGAAALRARGRDSSRDRRCGDSCSGKRRDLAEVQYVKRLHSRRGQARRAAHRLRIAFDRRHRRARRRLCACRRPGRARRGGGGS
jgi:hypothetical protein